MRVFCCHTCSCLTVLSGLHTLQAKKANWEGGVLYPAGGIGSAQPAMTTFGEVQALLARTHIQRTCHTYRENRRFSGFQALWKSQPEETLGRTRHDDGGILLLFPYSRNQRAEHLNDLF